VQQELRHGLSLLLKAIISALIDVISICTSKAQVMSEAVAAGASLINDVRAFAGRRGFNRTRQISDSTLFV